MHKNYPLRHLIRFCSISLLAVLLSACDTASNSAGETTAETAVDSTPDTAVATTAEAAEKTIDEQVNGLWMYTGLITKDGTEMPLTGPFLFKDGVFMQQAIFNDGDFEQAGSMAHAGPFRAEPATGSVHLIAAQTISTDPAGSEQLSFRANTEHDVTVTREGNDLTLIFGMGTSTVQTFEYVGPGEGDLYALENGSLAFVDGYFILVEGDADSVTTGYGTYTKNGEDLSLQVIRWAEADASGARNARDVTIEAQFDGKNLTLADGRSFQVK